MGLDALLAKLQREAVTPVTPSEIAGVTEKALPLRAVPLVTPVTPKNNNAEESVTFSANDPPGKAWRWRIDFPDRNPLEVAFSPEATHAEVLGDYPDALATEQIEPGGQPSAPLTASEETAIRAWLALIEETDEATIDDVLTLCRHDDDARAYYLGRAGYAVTGDDRRRCSQCSSLRSGVCVVARPGGLVSAIVGYRPALPGVLHRCAGYSPNASDTDQRSGRERWPGLIQKGSE